MAWWHDLISRFATPDPDSRRPARIEREQSRPTAGAPLSIEREITAIGQGQLQIGAAFRRNASQNGIMIFNPDDVISGKGFREYRAMKTDDMVKFSLSTKKLLTYGRDWDVDPAGDDDDSKDIAEFIRWNFQRANFQDLIRHALSMFDYGFSLGEIIWEVTEYKGAKCIALKEIVFRDPDSFEILMDIKGRITEYEQTSYTGEIIKIPPNKIVHCVHDREFENFYGVSDLRACYRNWWSKKYLINFMNVYLEKVGTPTLMMTYPQGAGETLKTTLVEILRNMGVRSEILVPKGVEVEVVESKRAGQPEYLAAIAYHDNAIARAILFTQRRGEGDSTRGSESESRLALRTMFKAANEAGNVVLAELMSKVVIPLVDMNFANPQGYPSLRFGDFSEYEGPEIADAIRLLHNAGIIDMDQADVNYARQALGLPVRDEDNEDEVLRPNPAPQGVGANPPTSPNEGGATQGNDRAETE